MVWMLLRGFLCALILASLGRPIRAQEPPRAPSGELWVTVALGAEVRQALVSTSEDSGYVLSFVKGMASSEMPLGDLCKTLVPRLEFDRQPGAYKSNEPRCPISGRVLRAHECIRGNCVPLFGAYAGRSPYAIHQSTIYTSPRLN